MAGYEPFDWYDDDPTYYDIIFDLDTDREADFLAQMHERYVTTRGRRVLEPASGSGRLMLALSERGFGVTGLDVSPAMNRFARARLRDAGHRATLVRRPMEDFAFPQPFDLAHCLVSTFKHLATEEAARGNLRCMADALKPGGVYVLGLHLSDYDDRRRSRERWMGARDGVEVVCNIQSWPPDRRTRTEQVRSRLVVSEGDEVRRFESSWSFRTYGLDELKGLLRSEPRLEHVDTYDFTHDPDHLIHFDGEQVDVVLILRRRADRV